MIDKWNKKIAARDVACVEIAPGTGGTKWSTSQSRELQFWLSDLIQRTLELKEKLDKKPDVVEMSLTEYNNLTTKKPNTIYAID